MAESADPKIRASAASHPQVPVDVFWVLASDPEPFVRMWAVRNPRNTENDILRIQATVDDDWVQTFCTWWLTTRPLITYN